MNTRRLLAILLAIVIVAFAGYFAVGRLSGSVCTLDDDEDVDQMLVSHPGGTTTVPRGFLIETGPLQPTGPSLMLLPSALAASFARDPSIPVTYICRVRDEHDVWWVATRAANGTLRYALSEEGSPPSK